MANHHHESDLSTLTRRQRLVCRAYFVSGFRTGRAATAMGCSRQYIYEVRTMPAAIKYLEDMEAATPSTPWSRSRLR